MISQQPTIQELIDEQNWINTAINHLLASETESVDEDLELNGQFRADFLDAPNRKMTTTERRKVSRHRSHITIPFCWLNESEFNFNPAVLSNAPLYKVNLGNKVVYIDGKKFRQMLNDGTVKGRIVRKGKTDYFVVTLSRKLLLDNEVK